MSGAALGAVRDWLVPEASCARARAVRALVGAFGTVYLVVRSAYLGGAARHAPADFAPVGVCAVLGSPLPEPLPWVFTIAAIVLGAAFTAGWAPRAVGPAFFATLLWVLSYASSWGKILHSENLLVLHVLVFAAAGEIDDPRKAGWALRAASVATVLTYFVAGTAKLRSGGAAWLSGGPLGDWLAWDALRKIELGSLHSPLAAHVASSPLLLRALAIYTVLVELGAPLALCSRRAAYGWGMLAWLFHAGILATMAIGFFYPLSGIAFAPLLPQVERLSAFRLRRRSR